MSWEALRLTSKSPSEVYAVLGPHGVDELLRDARNSVWREYPAESRTVALVHDELRRVFERNMRHWATIKKPTPEAFFANMPPHQADGHIRQALVLTWMMMPREGGRDFKMVGPIVRSIFQRMMTAWDEDDVTFTRGKTKKKSSSGKGRPKAKSTAKKTKKPAAKRKR